MDRLKAYRLKAYRGLYLSFGETVDAEVNRRLHALTARLLERPLAGVTDLVPGYTRLYCEYDEARLSAAAVRGWLEAQRDGLEETPPRAAKRVDIPVRYDGEDLPDIAARTGLSVEEVIARHAGRSYRVYAIGFTPGLPFMGEVDPALRLPRRSVPRPRVPANTVAMAGAQTGVYPTASPGGWNLLGQALVRLYDPQRQSPFLLEPGDEVRFYPAEGETPLDFEPLELLPPDPRHPLLRVREPGLLDLVVDAGRFMAGRFGLSRSGPLDARSAGLANRLVGNPPEAPLLELNLSGARFEALDEGVVAFAGWGMRPLLNGREAPAFESFALRRGDRLGFEPVTRGSRGYLALAGGLDSGQFMNSASVDLKGKIGRPLREGDILGMASLRSPRPGFGFRPYAWLGDPLPLRLLPGPQASAEALAALLRAAFTVTRADRMGVHLDGPPVPGGDVLSEPTPLGAVQVTSGGAPILLLNDRGTLGGYSKPAIIHPGDLPRVAQLRPGERLRFVALAR